MTGFGKQHMCKYMLNGDRNISVLKLNMELIGDNQALLYLVHRQYMSLYPMRPPAIIDVHQLGNHDRCVCSDITHASTGH